MNYNPPHSKLIPIRHVASILLMILAPGLNAAQIVDGKLGHWITKQASPRLAEILSNHPRFKGEKIKITAMQGGQPARITDKLTEYIRKQLTDDLLAQADVKIVFDDINRCQTISVDTILGIEVEKQDNRNYRVSLAFVDVDEGIWINRTNLSWLGRVTNSQRLAYEAQLDRMKQASVFAPHEFTEMATALHAQMKCNEFITTPVFFTLPTDDIGRGVLRKMRERMSGRRQITLDKFNAASVITLTSPDPNRSIGTLFLELSEFNRPGQALRIAELKVSNSSSWQAQPSTPGKRPNLISALRINEGRYSRNVCDTRLRGCVPVRLNLAQSAYTIIFFTVHGKINLVNCESPRRQRTGKYDFGLNVPATSTPGLGFYALAMTDKKTARTFHQLLRRNASGCGHNGEQNQEWLSSFADLLDHYRNKTDWQAIHLVRTGNRLVQI